MKCIDCKTEQAEAFAEQKKRKRAYREGSISALYIYCDSCWCDAVAEDKKTEAGC